MSKPSGRGEEDRLGEIDATPWFGVPSLGK